MVRSNAGGSVIGRSQLVRHDDRLAVQPEDEIGGEPVTRHGEERPAPQSERSKDRVGKCDERVQGPSVLMRVEHFEAE